MLFISFSHVMSSLMLTSLTHSLAFWGLIFSPPLLDPSCFCFLFHFLPLYIIFLDGILLVPNCLLLFFSNRWFLLFAFLPHLSGGLLALLFPHIFLSQSIKLFRHRFPLLAPLHHGRLNRWGGWDGPIDPDKLLLVYDDMVNGVIYFYTHLHYLSIVQYTYRFYLR